MAAFNTRNHRTFVQDFFLGNPFVFFFFFFSSDTFWTLEPDHPPSSLSPSISPIWSHHPHPPSLIKNPCLTLHLQSQPSRHPPSRIKNPRLTLHLRSQPSPHRLIHKQKTDSSTSSPLPLKLMHYHTIPNSSSSSPISKLNSSLPKPPISGITLFFLSSFWFLNFFLQWFLRYDLCSRLTG